MTVVQGDNESLSASSQLAAEIKRRREGAGLSQLQLAQRIGYTRQYVSLAERSGHNLPSLDIVRAIDKVLGAGGHLIELRDRAKLEQQGLRNDGNPRGQLIGTRSTCRPSSSGPVLAGTSGETVFAAPAGRFFLGAEIDARRFPAEVDERVLGIVPYGFVDDPFLRRPRRGLVVGVSEDQGEAGLFGLDSRQARRRLTGVPPEARLLMTRAYVLDDLSMAILWAVANLDEALLDDDAALAEARDRLAVFEHLPRSAGGQNIAADLAPVSRMWLGSDFCARHVLRHTESFGAPPQFWTREQRGEEASTWLFFSHKFDYLHRTTIERAKPEVQVRRTFCIPDATVMDSSRPERVLLFLAVALMESFDIRVDVATEPEYSAVEGFALDEQRAVVANWVGTDDVWQVDLTDDRPRLRDFRDALGYARTHSPLHASTAHGRLRSLAEYLQLDWTWLSGRCAELGEYGTGGLAHPRSRLLSLKGLDRACRFVGDALTEH